MIEAKQQSVAPFGAWHSPLSAGRVAQEHVFLTDVQLDGSMTHWIEGRAADDGRYAIVRHSRPDGRVDMTPRGANVRSRVHEYGGAAYLAASGSIWYSEFVDGRIYQLSAAEAGVSHPLTPEGPWRYADFAFDAVRRRLVCVREDHGTDAVATNGEAVNALVSVSLDDGRVEVLVAGNDFYSAPRISPEGTQLAWLTWNHPQMPWDGAELWMGEFDDQGEVHGARRLAGGSGDGLAQPQWSPDGRLYVVSDRSGWWNIELLATSGPPTRAAVTSMAADFAPPDWFLGLSNYGFVRDGSLVTVGRADGRDRLYTFDRDGVSDEVPLPFEEISYLRADGSKCVFIAGSSGSPIAVWERDVETGAVEMLSAAPTHDVGTAWVSVPEAMTYATRDGRTGHAFFYPPTNPAFEAPAGTLPPLIVRAHGGPTAATTVTLNDSIQFFTSRGFAFVDVDYAGSTGYGHAYRKLLDGHWGVFDVEDCVAAARLLVDTARVDPDRLAICGPSAGGYTSLAASCSSDMFRAAVSYFGITDPRTWSRDTHKFESHYTDSLVGNPADETLYDERSPVLSAPAIRYPVLVVQGLEDRVVPPDQAEAMTAALRRAGVPHAYLLFEGEGHDFRRATSIERALEAELVFYLCSLGLRSAGEAVSPCCLWTIPPSRPPAASQGST